MKRCNCKAPSTNIAYRLKESLVESQQKIMANDTIKDNLYIDIVYHIIYNIDSENISYSRIKSQHKCINDDFNMNNIDTSKVPDIEPYNFKGVRGISNIRFLPLNENDLIEGVNIIRVKTTRTSFSGVSDIVSNGGSPTINGKLNVYIGTLNGILGEAYIQGNKCSVLNSSVGGVEYPGTISNYNIGRTLTHEIGHNFGLYHIFMDIYSGSDVCTNNQLHPDIPKQSLSNGTNAYLLQNNGVWTGNGAYNTCGENDQFMNFMDYVTDTNMVMFSDDQCNDMRVFIQTSGIFNLQNVILDGVPKDAILELGVVTSRNINISWFYRNVDDPMVLQYKLEYLSGLETIYKTFSNIVIDSNIYSPNKYNYIIQNLIPGLNYKFRLIAINNIGSSNPSNIISVTTLGEKPEIISTPKFISINNNKLNLYWLQPNNMGSKINFIFIEESIDNSQINKYPLEIFDTFIFNREFTINNNSIYKYRVATENENGISEYSDWSESIQYSSLNYRIYSSSVFTNKLLNVNNSIISDIININSDFLIDNIEVIINKLTHTWVGDIKIKLKKNNNEVILVNSPGTGYWGSNSDNFVDVIFSDTSNNNIENISNDLDAISGTYKPTESLSIFKTSSFTGNWELIIEDLYPLEDDGVLDLWSIKLYYPNDIPIWTTSLPLKFNDNTITSNTIDISWGVPNSSLDILSYRLRYSINDGDYIIGESILGNITNYTINNLNIFTNYKYQVQANNIIGFSDWSNEIIFTTKNVIPEWSSDSTINYNISVFSVANEFTINLDWTKIDNLETIDYKVIIISNNVETNYPSLLEPKILENSYNINNCIPNQLYLIKVKGCNTIGFSEWLETSITLPKVVPYWKSSIINIDKTNNFIDISWSNPNNGGDAIINYDISIYKNSIINQVNLTKNQYRFLNLLPNTLYTIKIRALNTIGYSEYLIRDIITNIGKPFWIDNKITINNQSPFNLNISWLDANDGGRLIDSYILKVNGQIIMDELQTNYDIVNLVPNTEYNVEIIAHNMLGYSDTYTQIFTTIMSPPYWLNNSINSVDIDNISSKISWIQPDNGGDNIIEYIIKNIDNSLLVTTNNNIILDKLEPNTSYDIELTAKNSIGISDKISYILERGCFYPTWSNVDNNFTILNITQSSINLSWLPINAYGLDILSYDIVLSCLDEEQVTNTNTNSISFINLKTFTNYTIKVCGKVTLGYSPWKEFSFITNKGIPVWISNNIFNIISLLSNSIKLEWNIPNTSGLNIWYNIKYKQVDGLYTIIASDYTSSSILLDNLLPNTKYIISINANNSLGSTNWLESDVITTKSGVPFWGSTIINTNIGIDNLDISWNDANGNGHAILGYNLQLISNSNSLVEQIMEDNVTNILNYTFFNLSPFTNYVFKIQAYNSLGNTIWLEKSILTLANKPKWNDITLQISEPNSHDIISSWNSPYTGGISIKKYIFEKYLDDWISIISTDIETLDINRYRIKKLNYNTVYKFRVKIINQSDLESDWLYSSETLTSSIAPYWSINSKIEILEIGETSVKLSWNNLNNGGKDILKYIIKINNLEVEIDKILVNNNIYLVNNLLQNHKYIFGIKSINTVGESKWLLSKEIITLISNPKFNNDLYSNEIEKDSILLEWIKPFTGGIEIKAYELKYKLVNSENFEVIMVNSLVNYYNLENLEFNKEYDISLRAINKADLKSDWITLVERTLGTVPYWDSNSKIKIISISCDNVIIKWDFPNTYGMTINNYNIFIKKNSDYNSVDGEYISYNEYDIKNLVPNTYYKIKIEAINIYGSCTIESDIFKTEKSIPVLKKIACVSYFDSIKINWDKSDLKENISKYDLYYKEENMDDFSILHNSIASNLNQVIVKLEPFKNYQFKLEIFNDIGSSVVYSNWVKTYYSKYFNIEGNLIFEGNIVIE